jgi:copper transport protein
MLQTRLRNWVLLAFTICVMSIWICLHSVAYAHAYIIKSNPAANQALGTPLHTVQIWFDESVQTTFNALKVSDENGQRVDLNDAHIDQNNPDLLECNLKAGLSNGTYSVNWRVISADGHPVEGIIPFSIGAGKINSEAHGASSHGYLPGADMLLIRWLMYLSMMCYLGLFFFHFFILPKKLSTLPEVQSRFSFILWITSAGIAISVILSLPLQTKIDANTTWVQAIHPQFLKTVISLTRFGHLWIIQAEIVLVLFFLGTLMAKDLKGVKHLIYFGAGLLTIGLLISKSMSGHAASTTHPVLSITVDVLHMIAASVWLGSLLGLVLLIPRPFHSNANIEHRQLYWELLRRFSPWGAMSVLVLMLTGLYAALQQIPTVYALLHTNYGKTLFVKLGIFSCMLGLAVYHWLSGHFREGNLKRNLNKTIWIEFGLGIVVLAVTAILTNLPTAMSNPGPIAKTKTVPHGEIVTLRISPNIAGANVFVVELTDKSGKPDTDVQQVTLSFKSLDMTMGTDTVRLVPGKPGQYTAQGLYLNMGGHWNVHLHLLTNSFDDLDADFRLVVGSAEGE